MNARTTFSNYERDPQFCDHNSQDEEIDNLRNNEGWIDNFDPIPISNRRYDFPVTWLPVIKDSLQLRIYLEAILAEQRYYGFYGVRPEVMRELKNRWEKALSQNGLKTNYWYAFADKDLLGPTEQDLLDFITKVYVEIFLKTEAIKRSCVILRVGSVPFRAETSDLRAALEDYLDTPGAIKVLKAFWSDKWPEKWVHSGYFDAYVDQTHVKPLLEAGTAATIIMTVHNQTGVADRALTIKLAPVQTTFNPGPGKATPNSLKNWL